MFYFFFFFNDTATTEIYTFPYTTLFRSRRPGVSRRREYERDGRPGASGRHRRRRVDRKSTRLNSSHLVISYAVFCLKKKKKKLPQMLLNNFQIAVLCMFFNISCCVVGQT